MRVRVIALSSMLAAAVLVTGSLAATARPTPAQLALMPLPKSALPAAAEALPLNRQSGIVSNQDAAGDATNLVSAGRLARLGRLTGYSLDYADAGLSALVRGKGLLGIETSVDLYRDAAAARAGMAFWRADEATFTRLERSGVEIAFGPAAAPRVGDERWSFAGSVTVGKTPPIYGIDVAFRVGAIVADLTVTAADERTGRALVTSLARKFERRIRAVLDGKVSGRPIRLPGKPEAGPPENGMDLAAMAVKPADLGGGRVTKEGFMLDTDLDPLSAYVREIGGSPFDSFSETIELFHSPTEAGFNLSLLATTLALDRPATPGRKARPDEIAYAKTRKLALTVGDEARALLMNVRFGDGTTVNEAVVLVRVGSIVAYVGVATPGSVAIPSKVLTQLARVTVGRVAAGLQKSHVA